MVSKDNNSFVISLIKLKYGKLFLFYELRSVAINDWMIPISWSISFWKVYAEVFTIFETFDSNLELKGLLFNRNDDKIALPFSLI